MKRVVVGLSGGVDSSVAAYLLQQQGYDVVGLFMKNWHDDSVTISKECPWLDDSNDAMLVAEKLHIPFQTLDLSEEYKERIVNYMFKEYEKGRTPNPDILCNRDIKFDIFLKHAIALGADYVATGHYCRKESFSKKGKVIHKLLAGADVNKDQSYFLCQLSQEQLSRAIFPIGELQKSDVRAIAAKADLITAEKKDSQGLCFIGKVKLPEFLQQQLQPKEGNIVEIPETSELYQSAKPKFLTKHEELTYLSKHIEYHPKNGKVVGTHQGAHFFTIGQRKGLGVGGTSEPLFVIATDVITNTIYTGQGRHHPGLYKKALFVSRNDVHWVREDIILEEGDCLAVKARIRYRQPLADAILYRTNSGVFVEFNTTQSAITEGQFVAWYCNNELLGSGVIS